MPLVFVHGVSTREGASYRAGVEVKRRFFDLTLDNLQVGGRSLHPVCVDETVSFPYWGDLASKFHWNSKSLPGPAVEKLGGGEEADLGALVATIVETVPPAADDPNPLCRIAKTEGLPAVVFILNAALISTAPDHEREALADLVLAISRYAEENALPEWAKKAKSDAALIDNLIANALPASIGVEPLGVNGKAADALRSAGILLGRSFTRIGELSGYVVSAGVVQWKRAAMNATIGEFVGDVFRYLVDCRSTGKPPSIGPRVIKALQAARNMPGPLVVVAHSLGGVITYDLLTHDVPKLEVDLFVTVGSQVAFFEEMKLYRSSDESLPDAKTPKLPRPVNVQRWLNVHDPVDFFAYVCAPVFDGVADLAYPTHTDSIKAHSAYFERIDFYRRLRKRLDREAP